MDEQNTSNPYDGTDAPIRRRFPAFLKGTAIVLTILLLFMIVLRFLTPGIYYRFYFGDRVKGTVTVMIDGEPKPVLKAMCSISLREQMPMEAIRFLSLWRNCQILNFISILFSSTGGMSQDLICVTMSTLRSGSWNTGWSIRSWRNQDERAPRSYGKAPIRWKNTGRKFLSAHRNAV